MSRPVALAALAALGVAIHACGGPPPVVGPSPSTTRATAQGTIVVSFEPRDTPSRVFNGSAHVRAVDSEGATVAQGSLTDGVRLVVPAGTYRVEVLFVYVGDWMSCRPDPALPGQQTCSLPSLSPVPGCAASPVTIGGDAVVELRHRIVSDGSCLLELAPHESMASPT